MKLASKIPKLDLVNDNVHDCVFVISSLFIYLTFE